MFWGPTQGCQRTRNESLGSGHLDESWVLVREIARHLLEADSYENILSSVENTPNENKHVPGKTR